MNKGTIAGRSEANKLLENDPVIFVTTEDRDKASGKGTGKGKGNEDEGKGKEKGKGNINGKVPKEVVFQIFWKP